MTDTSPGTPSGTSRDRGTWLIVALSAVVVVLVAALVFVVLNDDDDDDVESADTTTSTSSTTTTTEPTATSADDGSTTSSSSPTSTTSTTVLPSDGELDNVVWPGPASDIRYDDPLTAVEGFSRRLLGFTDPTLGPYMEGDSRSGEVEIRADAQGPPTTVLVRKLSDDTWWILAAVTESIELREPGPGAEVSNPMSLSGRSRAFEAAVDVSVFELGDTTSLGDTVVMGSGGSELGPFSGEVTYDEPSGTRGVVVLYTVSARDGEVWEAIASPITFG